MIYLTLSHSLEELFPFGYAISTFLATPYMPSGPMMRGKDMISEMTDVDRPCIPLKNSALPVSASSPGKRKRKKGVDQNLDCRVSG